MHRPFTNCTPCGMPLCGSRFYRVPQGHANVNSATRYESFPENKTGNGLLTEALVLQHRVRGVSALKRCYNASVYVLTNNFIDQ